MWCRCREAGLASGLTDGQTLRNVLLLQGLMAMFPALVIAVVFIVINSSLVWLADELSGRLSSRTSGVVQAQAPSGVNQI